MTESGAMPEPADWAEPEAGTLLVALPTLEDPNFHRTVVLLLAAGEEGALGVVLNRTNEVPVRVLLPGWEAMVTEPASMFQGGPVSRSSVIGVGRARPAGEGVEGFQAVTGGLGTIDLNRDPDELEPAIEKLRLFSGYAGWADGQLEDEMASGSWLVLPFQDDDVFTDDPEGLWRRVLLRQGGRMAIYANAPPSLSMN